MSIELTFLLAWLQILGACFCFFVYVHSLNLKFSRNVPSVQKTGARVAAAEYLQSKIYLLSDLWNNRKGKFLQWDTQTSLLQHYYLELMWIVKFREGESQMGVQDNVYRSSGTLQFV